MRVPGWLLAGIPLAAALAAHSGALPGDFCLDDAILAEGREDLRSAHPRMVFLERYLRPDRPDPGYRPITFATFAWNHALGEGAWAFRAVNVLLHAAAACLAYAVLARALADPPLAAMGAALFAVLPIHADAVARILGRGEILAGIALFAVLALSLRSSSAGGPGSPALAFLAGGIALLGLFAGPGALVLAPLAVLAATLLLSGRVPRRIAAGTAAAVIGYLLVRETVLAGPRIASSSAESPLAALLAQILNGARLAGLHAVKVIAPLGLSADYSHAEVEVLPLSSWRLWLAACVVLGIAALALLPAWLARRRGAGASRGRRVLALAPLLFVLAVIGPAAAVAFPGGPIFAERHAYAASIAFPLAVAAAIGAWFPARGRGLALAFLALLAIAYGSRTWARNRDWADSRTMGLQVALDAPGSARAHLWAAEAYLAPWRESGPEAAGGPEEARRKGDLQKAAEEVERALGIEESWRARALLGEVLLEEKRYAEAVEHLERADGLLAKADPARREPSIRALRGEACLRAGKAAEAAADLDGSVRLYDRLGRRPRAAALNCRGLIRAQVGKLEEALADFTRASEVRPGLPEVWNNRGFCRFQLGDHAGAIEDYEKGLEACRRKGILGAPSGDSAVAFLLRISAVHVERAKARRGAGNEAAAREDEERAAALRAEAGALAAPRKNP